MEHASKTDGRLERGDAKRRAILDRAVDLASVSGLEALSIGRLATDLGISKSGAVLHFGSKEELQLGVIAHAARRFVDVVVVPAADRPEGLERLWELAKGWLRHIEIEVFPGGCFFSTVGAEFNSRPGRVHDAIAEAHRYWVERLAREADRARQSGQLRADVVPGTLVFELDALLRHANLHHKLHADASALDHTRRAVRELLDRCAA